MKLSFSIILCLVSHATYSQVKDVPIYQEPVRPPYEDISPTMRDGKAGVVNKRTGDVLIPFEYDNIEMMSRRLFCNR